MIERLLVVPWVIGSNPHGGPIDLFLVPRLVKQRLWYILFCLLDGAYKQTLVTNQKE